MLSNLGMNLPTYLIPYTKQSFDQLIIERNKAISQRCREVGKNQTLVDTGWSLTVILKACEENNVPCDPRGPRRKIGEEVENTQVVESASNLPNLKSFQDPPNFSESSNPTDFLKIADELKRCNSVEFESLVRTCSSGEEYQNLFFDVQPPRTRIHEKRKETFEPIPDCVFYEQPEVLPPNAEKIQLSRGVFAIVDSDMVPILKRFTWSAKVDYRMVYAISTDKNTVQIKMHKYVLGLPNKSDYIVDHINHNALDNRRCNLRIVSNSDNQMNRKEHESIKSRFVGVHWWTDKWAAIVKVDSTVHKKYFADEVDAAKYYDELVVKLKGPEYPTNESKGLFNEQRQ